MDIFFCDLCTSRVTSVDLRGGLGMRQVDDVICGHCVELGKGKSWLEKCQGIGARTGTASTVAVPVVSPPVIRPVVTAPSPIDLARDRARTIDRDSVSAPVRPQIIQPVVQVVAPAVAQAAAPVAAPIVNPAVPVSPVTPTAAVALIPTENRPAASSSTESLPDEFIVPQQEKKWSELGIEDGVDRSGDEIATKRSVAQPDFSGLAGAFAALSSSAQSTSGSSSSTSFTKTAPTDDLLDFQEMPRGDIPTTEVSSRRKTETDIEVKKSQPVQDMKIETAIFPAVTPTGRVSRLGGTSSTTRKAVASDSASSSAKPGTGSYAKKPPTGSMKTPTNTVKTPTGSTKVGTDSKIPTRPPTGSVKTPTGSVKTPTGSTKTSTGKTTASLRAAQRTSQKNKVLTSWIILGTCALICLVITVSFLSSKPATKSVSSSEPLVMNLSEDVVNGIKSAREAAQTALQKSSPDEAELKSALAQIHALQPKLLEFEEVAKRQFKYTDEQVADALANAGWSDTNLFIRSIDDRLVRLHNDKTMK